jgi:hypothetical protein
MAGTLRLEYPGALYRLSLSRDGQEDPCRAPRRDVVVDARGDAGIGAVLVNGRERYAERLF